MTTWHVVLWKWESPTNVARQYNAQHVNALARAIRTHTPGLDVRIVCVTDNEKGIVDAETFPLWEDCGTLKNATKDTLPSCYRRLKLYDRRTQKEMGIPRGQRVVSIDLDTLVTGNLTEVLNKSGLFVGWKLAGTHHPHVYNGSFQMFTAGTLEDVWTDFDPDRSPREALSKGFLGSDQSWLSMKLIDREGCTDIPYPAFASYPLHCRRLGQFSVRHRLVFFHGKNKPWFPETRRDSAWIDRYWRP
jgi:hypothetical protein